MPPPGTEFPDMLIVASASVKIGALLDVTNQDGEVLAWAA
jgi:hypothetical protein